MPNYELYYEQLKVAHGADEETIKRAYKKLALKFHPDKNQGDAEATKKFLEIGTAYEVSRGSLHHTFVATCWSSSIKSLTRTL